MTALAPVAAETEFWRIHNLPRRTWTAEQALAAAEALSPQLLNERGLEHWNRCALLSPEAREKELARLAQPVSKGGEGCPIRLLPVQAIALIEAARCRGLYGALPVGAGKTLISFLLPHFFPHVRRPVLLLPGGLTGVARGKVGKTELEFDRIKKFWKTPQYPVRVMSYDLLSREEYKTWLCECEKCSGKLQEGETREPGFHPDLVIPDESQSLKNLDRAKTKKVMRYGATHVEVIWVFLTGSMMRKSIDDFAPHMLLALRDGAPVPWAWHIREAWKQAIDFSPKDGVYRHPGALLRLPRDGDDAGKSLDELAAEGVRKRMAETPGVIIRTEQSCDEPIYIRLLKPPDDKILIDAFKHFRDRKTAPAPDDNLDVSGNLEKILHGKQLSTGFYTRPVPRPPEEWYDARREAHKLIRDYIDSSERAGRPVDSAKTAFERLSGHPTVIAWKEIEKKYPYESLPVWLSMSVLGFAAEWIRLNSPALIWTSDIPVGEALEAMTGVPYFGAGGLDKHGNLLDSYDTRRSAIVSVGANKLGRNLSGWNRGLAINPPQNEADWEQGILGRMHRQGQVSPVYLDVIIASADSLRALDIACEVARHVGTRQGFKQKILLANIDWSAFPMAEIMSMSKDDPRKEQWTFS